MENEKEKPSLHLLRGDNITSETLSTLYKNLTSVDESPEEVALGQRYLDDEIDDMEYDRLLDELEKSV